MFHVRVCAWLAVASLLLSTHPVAAQTPSKPVDAKAIAALIAQLGNADFQQREAATRSLETIGRPALAALREAAEKHADAEVRRRANGLVEKIKNSLEQLLQDYKSYGLPLPPKDAPLVRFRSGGGGTSNGVEQPPRYSLGFLLKEGTKEEPPDILRGTFRYQPAWNPPIVLLDPVTATVPEIDGWAKDAGHDLLPLAIQCKARGWDSLAQTFFEKKPADYQGRSPQITVRHEAWGYWTGRLSDPDSDRAVAARHLHALIVLVRELNTAENQLLLKSLDAALVPSKAKPGSLEALIDALVDVASCNVDFFSDEPDPRYLRLIEAGFEAVPVLSNHLDDIRLTRVYWPGFNNFRGYHLQVRHLVSGLLEGLAGDELDVQPFDLLTKKTAQQWWSKARKRGEEAHVLAQVLPKDGQFPNGQLLRLILKKYPQQLPKVYQTLLDNEPRMQSWPVACALAKTAVAREKKIEIYSYAARHKNLEHRNAALNELVDLDHERFIQLLVETLNGLPKMPEREYWMCREAWFASHALRTDEPRAWQALEKAARKSSVGLRLQMLDNIMCVDPDLRRKQRLALLAAFLDDSTLRDMKTEPGRYDGFPAGYDFPRLEVRNYAALEIARLLKLDRKPQPTWDAEQWARFRDEVREALKR
jgi:hypothetical protein